MFPNLFNVRKIIDRFMAENNAINLMDTVNTVRCDQEYIYVVLSCPRNQAAAYETIRKNLEKVLRVAFPQQKVMCALTSDRPKPTQPTRKAQTEKSELPFAKKVIAIASGKGGVGKSTIAVHLSLALARMGYAVGLVDADIHGPSLAHVLKVDARPEMTPEKKLLPIHTQGIQCLSMGMMGDPDQPVLWRGPMVQSAVQQMLTQSVWGELDYLMIDMPPGTGDVALMLCQLIPLSGVVIVSTPQDVALLDAHKAVVMFQKFEVPIIGLVENMSLFTCPHCHQDSPIFGCEGAQRYAEEHQLPFLGHLPLDLGVRQGMDAGTPVETCGAKTLGLINDMAQKLR